MTTPASISARRWRLILGRYANRSLTLSSSDAQADQVLGYLYDREYKQRGHRMSPDQGGGLDPSAITALDWLGQARQLFPESTMERLETDAITRYGLTELLADPAAVETVAASPELAASLLRMRGRLDAATAEGMRVLIKKVIDDIVARLRPRFMSALTGVRHRYRRSMHQSSRNFDWRRTITANLKNVDPDSHTMLVDDVRFFARQRRKNLDWRIIVLVDQSGSMADSVLHSAAMASIMAGLPGIDVRLILFDTSIVDMSHVAHDPVEVLMTAQLGGGTDIAQAMQHAETLISQPSKTVVAVVTDFDEGGSVGSLVASVKRMAESGVTLLGLASVVDERPWYNRTVAQKLADVGMQVAAMTPDQVAAWLAEVIE